MTHPDEHDQLSARGISRRDFGRAATVVGVAATAGGIFTASSRVVHAAPSDVDILNFALNLEYLEAEFYTMATTGKTIDQLGVGITGTGDAGPTTGGCYVPFGSSTSKIMMEIAEDERHHVEVLRGALGSAAIAKPAINLDAAGVTHDDRSFLALARTFEDVGVSAYGGAAKLIQSKEVLEAAARIALTEAYHAGNIRLIVALKGIPTQQTDANDYPPPPSGDKYFCTSRVGLAKIRTTSMVLAIVYAGGPGTTRGGFFPDGVNGSINTV